MKKLNSYQDLEHKANLVRKWCLVSTTEAGSGHPTSCMSSADITTVLFDKFFHYDLKNPHNPFNDRLVFSKGHAAPLLYTLYALSGAFPIEELKTLRKFDSPLEGHPTPNFKYTEAATGSLGQGLSVGAGLAYGIRSGFKTLELQTDNLPKVFVLMGDGELAEGSVWEGANFASHYKLNNLIAILDINRLGQSQETMFGSNTQEYANRFKAFGWEVVTIDGHNFKEIEDVFEKGVKNKSDKPFVIVASTKKGKGVSFLEDKDGWHGKPLKKEDLEKALLEMGEIDENLRFTLSSPKLLTNSKARNIKESDVKSFNIKETNLETQSNKAVNISYQIGQEVATREVYGEVLAKIGEKIPLIFSLDADVKNSTYSMDFKKVFPDRFIECFIAEQNMVGVGVGLSRLGFIPFVSTFAAFLTRAFDQVRMAAVSKSNIKFVGSHAGVSIGEDGASQMGLEDIAMFSVLPNSVVLHPSDAVSTIKLIPQMVLHNGICYLRTLRPKTQVLYDSKEDFVIGGSKVLKSSQKDMLTIVGAGITVFEALKAYEELKKKGIFMRVLDCYSIKPIDKKTLIKSVKETDRKIIITVEDHFEHGGLGDSVLEAVSKEGVFVEKMAVDHISHSGLKEELLSDAKIDARNIIKRVEALL